ncbi:hypothetical protein HJFPF1_12181 [Paramyrothecium foliicola]|nr:hypothetical protein HJFPF1_12181 [Paramyrothecium foliicola]
MELLNNLLSSYAPITLAEWVGEDESIKWERYWNGIRYVMPNAGIFPRRKWADNIIGTYPHPQRPNEETYMTAMLRHEGHDHGLATVSIYKSNEKLETVQSVSEQTRATTRERKFDRIRAWFAEDMRKWGLSKERFIRGLYFPSRIVDLGTAEEQQECLSSGNHASPRLKLISLRDGEPCMLPNNEPWIAYAALSHRWGESTKACVTTQANLAARLEGFEFSQLCQTFKDAIMVTREMGIRYIWIDSLCIVQDSKEDWENESQIMGDVYLHAIVTLAAHSFGEANAHGYLQGNSSDIDGGAGFLDGALAAEGELPVLLGHLDEAQGPTYVYAQRRRMFEVDISNSQLSSRGWILQERLLSPRLVHFFHSQLYYESRYFNIVRAEDRTPALLDPDKLREFVTKQENKEGSTPFEWFKIVERFSACQLTQSSDKLIALAGLAKQFQRTSKQEYVAGIWADRAIKGLMWIAKGEPLIRRRGRAPSWSWASVDGHIKYPSILFDRPFKVVPEMMLQSILRTSLEEPKHLPGAEADNAEALFVKGHLKEVTLGSHCRAETAELIRSAPIANNLLPELDRRGTYRDIFNASDALIGWASLDKDENIVTLPRRVFAAVVASEECWVMRKDPSNILWYTFPPSPEFEAFHATGKVEKLYSRIFEVGSEGDIPIKEALELEPERELVKTYWVLLLEADRSDAMRLRLAGDNVTATGCGADTNLAQLYQVGVAFIGLEVAVPVPVIETKIKEAWDGLP